MSRTRIVFLSLSLLVVLPLASTNLLARNQPGDEDSLIKHLAVFTEALNLVNQAYVEPAKEQEVMAGAIDGVADALDPFSFFLPADSMAAYAQARAVGTRHSGLILVRDRGFIYVVGVAANSPGAKADVHLGDMVAEINGENTRSTPLWKTQTLLAQKAGTEVTLKLFRDGDFTAAKVVLGPYEAKPVEYQELEGAAVIRFSRIEAGTAAEAAAALSLAVAGEQSHLLFDLRGVSGGENEEAFKVAGLLVDGDLGSLKSRDDDLVHFRGSQPRWQGKIVVLIDRGTLGAAEVLANVLRQKADAELVGERSFGYAGRLRGVELPSGGQLWLTDAFYTGPDGEPLRESLQPDLFVSRRARGDGDATANKDGKKEKDKDVVLERGLERLLQEKEESAAPEQQAA
jgi:carboxyl-terminal processing protease